MRFTQFSGDAGKEVILHHRYDLMYQREKHW